MSNAASEGKDSSNVECPDRQICGQIEPASTISENGSLSISENGTFARLNAQRHHWS